MQDPEDLDLHRLRLSAFEDRVRGPVQAAMHLIQRKDTGGYRGWRCRGWLDGTGGITGDCAARRGVLAAIKVAATKILVPGVLLSCGFPRLQD